MWFLRIALVLAVTSCGALGASPSWPEVGFLKPTTPSSYSYFSSGRALSSNGEILAVGAVSETVAAQSQAGAVYIFLGPSFSVQVRIEAGTPVAFAKFGTALAMSSDGGIIAVGASQEEVGGASTAGAVYIFERQGATDAWDQISRLVPAYPTQSAQYGFSLGLSADGLVLAVGSVREDSGATGIGGEQSDTSGNDSGAVFVYHALTPGGPWMAPTYIKADNSVPGLEFGHVALSSDGLTLAVGASQERSTTSGANAAQTGSGSRSGAVYMFELSGMAWSQVSFIKAITNEQVSNFGTALALNDDGTLLVAGSSLAGGGLNYGDVDVYRKVGSVWTDEQRIIAPERESQDQFGGTVAVCGADDTLAVGARDGGPSDQGAAHVFQRSGGTWMETALMVASTAEAGDEAWTVSLSPDCSVLVVGASGDDSPFGDPSMNTVSNSGAVYVFEAPPPTTAPTSASPTSASPTSRAPTTRAPTTRAPTTRAPTTRAPTTRAPTTRAPTTQAPTTRAPTTRAPTTRAPTTQAPTTRAPTTRAPTTQAPTTRAPTSRAPTTRAPTTSSPSPAPGMPTLAPSTAGPTAAPTTLRPTSASPTTTGAPSAPTASPTARPTQRPSTARPTATPTSASPTFEPVTSPPVVRGAVSYAQSVVIAGNTTFEDSTSVSVTQGTASLAGTLTVQVASLNSTSGPVTLQLVSGQTSGEFNDIVVDAPNLRPCETTIVTPNYEDTGLSVSIEVDSSGCTNVPLIAGVTVGGVLLLAGAAAAIGAYLHKRESQSILGQLQNTQVRMDPMD